MQKQKDKMQKEDTWIHTCCDICHSACGILVHRLDGVVVDIKGDPDCPNSLGKICGKSIAGIMQLYDPNRVKTPLRRTNPEKGLGVDPGWVRISWDEAMDILEEKLSKVRKEDSRKLVMTSFQFKQNDPTWGMAFGRHNAWAGPHCGAAIHPASYMVNGTFHPDYDADYINYLILFGNQQGFGAGVNANLSVQQMAAARKRGLKVVVVDPICNHAASKADEWVPILPGTDGALALAMINVLLNELGIYDRGFLKRYTNGPYLVKPDGYYARREGKPLVWDAKEGIAKTYDADVKDYAIEATEGSYVVDGIECKPAFHLLKEHVKKYTPEMAAEITTIPPATIRRVAEEFGREARIGSTIIVDGVELPYRPAAANWFRGPGVHKHGLATDLALEILNMIVGNFYVPGGHIGMNLVGPSWEWAPREHDGLVLPPTMPGEIGDAHNYYTTEVKPPEDLGLRGFYPSAIHTNTIPATLDPKKYQLPYEPEVLIVGRRNLFMGGADYKMTAEALKKFKFIVTFSTHLDETSEFADLVVPEAIYLEKLDVAPTGLNWGHSPPTGYWFWGVRQPVVPPIGEARDFFDVLIELADRIGFLDEFYKVCNVTYNERSGIVLKEPYLLDPSRKYTKEEIADRRFKSRFGEEKGLEWFQKNGFLSTKRTVDESYPLPWLKVRFPLYYENTLREGPRVKAVTESMGFKNWDIADYEALPEWKPCASYTRSGDFDLIVADFRLPTQGFSITAQNAWLAEVAEFNPYAHKILINTQTAKRKGIRDKDRICVESSVGKVTGEAKVTECIHPEVVGMSSHFGSLAKGQPVAYGKGANPHQLLPLDFDPMTSGTDCCVKAKVYKA